MRFRLIAITAMAAAAFFSPATAHAAKTYNILTAPDKSDPAFTEASKKANDDTIRAASSVTRALKTAHEIIAACGDCTVNVKLSEGNYSGRGDTAPQWVFAEVSAPKATLRILGGYNQDFSTRAPFAHKTLAAHAKGRSDAVLTIEAKKSKLKELVISGIFFDVGEGNDYSGSNLMKSSSPSVPILRFGYLETTKLLIADNVFMNAAHGVAAPLIRAAGNDAEVIVRNNIFVNNVYNWVVSGAAQKGILASYKIHGNSFILNWPFNPDPTTANPGALEIGNNYVAKKVSIQDNLFAYNVGGAIFPQWSEDRGPKMEVKHNLFYGNGAVFSPKNTADGAFVGKFTGGGRHLTFDIETIEEDFDWTASGNASFDPQLAIPKLDIKVAGYKAGDKTEMSVGGDASSAADDKVINIETVKVEGEDDIDIEIEVVSDDSGTDQSADDMQAASSTDTPEAEESPTDLSGFNFDVGAEDDFSGDIDIKNYAPRMTVDKAMIFPANPEAQAFGANPSRVVQFD